MRCDDGSWKASGSCKCGAIVAAVAKGITAQHLPDNESLQVRKLLDLWPAVEKFAATLRSKDSCDARTSKVLLCHFLRVFRPGVYGDNKDHGHFPLIQSDQQSWERHESNGVQAGILPFCDFFLSFLFGEWGDSWNLDSDEISQEIPSPIPRETVFHDFLYGCLRKRANEKDFNKLTKAGKLKLSWWMNRKGSLEDEEKTGKQADLGGYTVISLLNDLLDINVRFSS
jgi:hypothetical protein